MMVLPVGRRWLTHVVTDACWVVFQSICPDPGPAGRADRGGRGQPPGSGCAPPPRQIRSTGRLHRGSRCPGRRPPCYARPAERSLLSMTVATVVRIAGVTNLPLLAARCPTLRACGDPRTLLCLSDHHRSIQAPPQDLVN